RTLGEGDRERMKSLIVQLADDSYETRERASTALVAIGAAAEPLLREATKSTDVEVMRRAEECLRQIKKGTGAIVPMAAARIIAQRKPAGAVPVLLDFLPFADNDAVSEQVRAALAALAGSPSGSPSLLSALDDKDPLKRGAAGEALAGAGIQEHRAA